MKKIIFAGFALALLSIIVPVHSYAYDKSVMMPTPVLCDSGFSYYTKCVQYGMGCEPTGCPVQPPGMG